MESYARDIVTLCDECLGRPPAQKWLKDSNRRPLKRLYADQCHNCGKTQEQEIKEGKKGVQV